MQKSVYFLLVVVVTFFSCNKKNSQKDFIFNEGETQGTFYHITYLQPEGKDLHELIKQKLVEFDFSLSNYNPLSLISAINANKDTVTDVYFDKMFEAAQIVSENTHGAFDITVAPLVKAWGFGFGNKGHDFMPNIDSIMPFIGYKKIKLEQNHLVKENQQIQLDAAAIAQGYSCDVIADLLMNNGCENFMVEIGGEINCKGLNPKGKKWKIGIDKPTDDPVNENRELQTVVSISNVGLATSGNYRQFYYKDGKKYAHTINPVDGKPVSHNLLSATVIAPDGMMADAYATAFMVMGVDSSLAVCQRINGIDCYLIFSNEKGEFQVVHTPGFKKYLEEN